MEIKIKFRSEVVLVVHRVQEVLNALKTMDIARRNAGKNGSDKI